MESLKPMEAQSHRNILERLGYRVAAFTDPIEALEKFMFQPDEFDRVISDMTMPQMTGAKLSEKLQLFRKDIPIIISTGFSSIMDDEKAKQAGIAALVMKLVEKNELAKMVRKVLDEARHSGM